MPASVAANTAFLYTIYELKVSRKFKSVIYFRLCGGIFETYALADILRRHKRPGGTGGAEA
jgi:hypothetical protein